MEEISKSLLNSPAASFIIYEKKATAGLSLCQDFIFFWIG